MTSPLREYIHVVAAFLQFAVAVAGGAWAGHAADPSGTMLVLGMLGMGAGLVLGYALSTMLGLVFAPVLLVVLLRHARGAADPDAAASASRRDHVGSAMIAVVVMVTFASAVVVALLVWLLSDAAGLVATLLRFVAVAAVASLFASAARRVVV